ncbi:sensor histidine kinase [Thermomonospora cellulosilytica]|uniref:histidine kinase n=1 Tax=Thermomonospora cellulosilytica TaxID=1411118 RepID=A0A7W3N3T0_9ACTN|nr:nitrate- and nitrite sensing domain-containing protein [Thermomonospora cellulosilytica]MBA9007002.1 signal transduction histidine kinase [Thermomonospora cellulosilytica]
MAVAETEPAGPRRPPRRRSIRRRITTLLAVPLVSLIALWAYAAVGAVDAALNRYAIANVYDQISAPATAMSAHLQRERALTSVFLSTQGIRGRADLDAQRNRTDAAVAALRAAARGGIDEAVGPRAQEQLDALLNSLNELGVLRAQADARRLDNIQLIEGYGELIEGAFRMYHGQRVDDVEIFQQGRGLITIAWSREYMVRQDALITAVQASGGRLTAAERTALVRWATARQQHLERGMADLTGPPLEAMRAYLQSPDYRRYLEMETALVQGRGLQLPHEADAWAQTVPAVMATLNDTFTKAGLDLERRTSEHGDRIVLQLAAAGGVGLLVVVGSIVMSLLFARRHVQELRELREAADELADERLPDVVGRLRRGEDVDPAETTPLETGRTTEVARVAAAFAKVQRTAVETAVSEAHLRKGVARVFLNLAWRSQSLLHRQLRMLDEMERRVTDPDVLEDLFRIDHLTTRMRRHAEGLIILSGAAPGRGWSRPVPLEDVLRSAAAEVEDFTRVEVVAGTSASLTGAAVADIVHLLAELVENATVFSPPATEVLVRGAMVANGYAIEVIDRGIGIDPHERAALNQRLADPPEFDLADTDRLGLFVVARLAARHGVKVALQESVYGGTCAVVLLPPDLVTEGLPGADDVEPAGELTGPAMPHVPHVPQPSDPLDLPPAPGSIEVPAPRSWFDRPPQLADPNAANGTGGADRPPPAGAGPAPLPRRIRQANLVPELRGAGPAEPADQADPADPVPDRSAEQSRDLLASLQNGWLRGRADDEDGPEGAADGGAS